MPSSYYIVSMLPAFCASKNSLRATTFPCGGCGIEHIMGKCRNPCLMLPEASKELEKLGRKVRTLRKPDIRQQFAIVS